ncbi:MAG: hypothetical protein DRO05_03980, partial [Thermoproteota archaeon]
MRRSYLVLFVLALSLLNPAICSCGGLQEKTLVLFDESHSDLRANQLSNLFSIIEDFGFEVACGGLSNLKDFAMILIVGVSEPFSNQEVEAIQDFLKGGGSLLIACDPGNQYVNALSERLGVVFSRDYISEGGNGVEVRATCLDGVSFFVQTSGHVHGRGEPILAACMEAWEDSVRNDEKDPNERMGPFTVGIRVTMGGRAAFLASESLVSDLDAWEKGQEEFLSYLVEWLLLPQMASNSILEAEEEVKRAEKLGAESEVSRRALDDAMALISAGLYKEVLDTSNLARELAETSIAIKNATSLLSELSYELAQEEARGIRHELQTSELNMLLNSERTLRETWLSLVADYEKLSVEEKRAIAASIRYEAIWIYSKASSLLEALRESIRDRVSSKLETCSVLLKEANSTIAEISELGANVTPFSNGLRDLVSSYDQALLMLNETPRDAEILAESIEKRASKLLKDLESVRSKTMEVRQVIVEAETLLSSFKGNLESGKWLLIQKEQYKRSISDAEKLIESARIDLVQGKYEEALIKANKSVEILRSSFSSLRTEIEFREKVFLLGLLTIPPTLIFLIRRSRRDYIEEAAEELRKTIEEIMRAKEEGVDVTREITLVEEAGKMLNEVMSSEVGEESVKQRVSDVKRICREVLRNLKSEKPLRRICLSKMQNFLGRSQEIIDRALEARKSCYMKEEISHLLDRISDELQLLLKEFGERRYKAAIKRVNSLEKLIIRLGKVTRVCTELDRIYEREWKPKIGRLLRSSEGKGA